jgi:hypothetical protein
LRKLRHITTLKMFNFRIESRNVQVQMSIIYKQLKKYSWEN